MGSSPTSKFDIGQPIVIDLTDGSSFRAFVHAYDKSSTMLCLELIPSAEVAFMSTSNVKSVAALPAADHSRKWPSIRSFYHSSLIQYMLCLISSLSTRTDD